VHLKVGDIFLNWSSGKEATPVTRHEGPFISSAQQPGNLQKHTESGEMEKYKRILFCFALHF
jgi:hypothetical protein